jgi:hypothetical protein
MSFAPPVAPVPVKAPKPKRPPRQKTKTDPRLIAAARELRDRYLETINDGSIQPQGKYEVSRLIEASRQPMNLLAA